MSPREAGVAAHVVLACGVTLTWVAAMTARRAPWRHLHAHLGRTCLVGVVLSSLLAVALAGQARNGFGMLFALQPLLLALSGAAQFDTARWRVRALGLAAWLVAAGVLHGFVRMLATRDVIDIAAFALTAAVMVALGWQDLAGRRGPAWRAHALRMLATGWFYLAELLIFLVDPHPSVLAWAAAALLPLAAWMAVTRPAGRWRLTPWREEPRDA